MSIPHDWTLTQFLHYKLKYCIKSRAGSAREYYGDLSLKLNATQLLVKNMKLASIERTQEQSLVRKS